jgi:hypothetical protein
MTQKPGAGGALLLAGAILAQVMLEVSLGRVFYAPNLVALALMFLSADSGDFWAIEGAFAAGLCLDLVMHQPVGASSLGLICGMLAGSSMLGAATRESRTVLLTSAAAVSLVSDLVFMIAASRPLISSLGSGLLVVIPRAALTAAAGMMIGGAAGLVERARRAAES